VVRPGGRPRDERLSQAGFDLPSGRPAYPDIQAPTTDGPQGLGPGWGIGASAEYPDIQPRPAPADDSAFADDTEHGHQIGKKVEPLFGIREVREPLPHNPPRG
jgi:hypothetical protein